MPSTACITPANASSLNEWLDTVEALTCRAMSRKRSGSPPWSRLISVLATYSSPGVFDAVAKTHQAEADAVQLTTLGDAGLQLVHHVADLVDVRLHRHRGVHHQHHGGAEGVGVGVRRSGGRLGSRA